MSNLTESDVSRIIKAESGGSGCLLFLGCILAWAFILFSFAYCQYRLGQIEKAMDITPPSLLEFSLHPSKIQSMTTPKLTPTQRVEHLLEPLKGTVGYTAPCATMAFELAGELEAAQARIVELEEPEEKMAPVQGYPVGIPRWLHMEAYAVYCKKYGPQKALIEGWCRGGFVTEELDMFVPGWRDKISEMTKVKSKLHTSEAGAAAMRGFIQDAKLHLITNIDADGNSMAESDAMDCLYKALSTPTGRGFVRREVLEACRDALAHMKWCSSCAEGSWEDCEEGKNATDALATQELERTK